MNAILLLTLFSGAVVCQNGMFTELAAANEGYVVELQRRNDWEMKCLERFDSVVESKWNERLNKISTSDLGNVPDEFHFTEPSKRKYNTVNEEWLMDDGSPATQINTCFRKLAGEISPSLNQNEVKCLNELFSGHIQNEMMRESEFNDFLRISSRDQLPFRRFISFIQFVELMFQNRNVDALESLERTVYEHAESYLSTEQDKIDRLFIIEQECQWKDARALREARGDDAKYNEFVGQVRRSVNQQLANMLLKEWNLNGTLPREKYQAWSKARQNMLPRIYREVEKLRSEKKDAQLLCEEATKLAYKLSEEQAAILRSESNGLSGLKSIAVAKRTRNIEEELAKRKDFRRPTFSVLADDFEEGARCVSSFRDMIANHQRFTIALAFIDGRYSYPEIFCKGKNLNLGLISTRLCNCAGSFCVTHELAALFAEEYVMELGSDGIYRVVPSGVKSRKKVTNWAT